MCAHLNGVQIANSENAGIISLEAGLLLGGGALLLLGGGALILLILAVRAAFRTHGLEGRSRTFPLRVGSAQRRDRNTLAIEERDRVTAVVDETGLPGVAALRPPKEGGLGEHSA